MKHWLLTAGAVALMAGIALPVVAADAPKCASRLAAPLPDPKRVAEDAVIITELQKSVDRGSVPAMIDLATLKELRDSAGTIDRAGALDLYERAADKGDRTGRQKMCIAYLLGEGRPKDAAKGMDYCNALDDKDAVGLFARGYDYQMGLSGPADEGVAMFFYIAAVKAGNGDAAAAMAGIAIKAGKLDLARQWFRRGTYLGSADAMDGLAAMTEAGQGGLTDAIEAGWLYRNAADRGNVHATEQMASRTVEVDRVCLSISGKKVKTAEGTRVTGTPRANAPVITRTYADKSGAKTETLTYSELIGMLMRNFPESVMASGKGGMAAIECYIDGNHVFDACVLQREHPARVGLGRILETLFNGNMTISDTDDAGNPTARRLLAQTVRWEATMPETTGTMLRYGLYH